MSLATKVEELETYQKAFAQAMHLFEVSKSFPAEERYSLTDQMRRSSRSVCANLAEAWAKRRYEAHFLSKLTDADSENQETATWIGFAGACHYVDESTRDEMLKTHRHVGALLGQMIKNYRSFVLQPH